MSDSHQRERLLQDLSDILLDSNSSDRQRQSAKRALARLGNVESLARLAQLALANESKVMLDVLDLLEGRRSLEDVETVLVGFLYDPSPEVRQKALRLLRDKGSQRMLPSLDGVITAATEESTIFGPEELAAARDARQSVLDRFR